MRVGVEEIIAIGVDMGRVADGVNVAVGVKVGVAVFVGCAVNVPLTASAINVPICAVAVPLGVEDTIAIGVDEGRVALGVSVAGWV